MWATDTYTEHHQEIDEISWVRNGETGLWKYHSTYLNSTGFTKQACVNGYYYTV